MKDRTRSAKQGQRHVEKGMPILDVFIRTPYAMFLLEQIQIQINRVFEKQKSKDPANKNIGLIQHQIPFKKLMFVTFDNKPRARVVEGEFERKARWLSEGKSLKSFYRNRDGYHYSRGDAFIRKVLSVSKDFAKRLVKIAVDSGLTFDSMQNMFNFITVSPEFHGRLDDWKILRSLSSVDMPASIPEGDRDNVLMYVSVEINFLLVECLWMLYFILWTDYRNLIIFIKQHKKVDIIKKYLKEESLYLESEDIIDGITTHGELRRYIRIHYKVVNFQLSVIEKNIRHYIKESANFRLDLIGKPLKHSGKAKKSIYSYQSIDIRSGLNERLYLDEIKKFISKGGSFDQFVEFIVPDTGKSVDKLKQDLKEINATTVAAIKEQLNIDDGDNSADVLSDKQDNTSPENYSDDGKQQLINEIGSEFGRRMTGGLMRSRKLSGNPVDVFGFLIKVIIYAADTVRDKYYSKKLKEDYGVTSRTVRSYKRDLRKGEIKIDAVPEDLSERDILKIKEQKKKRRQHKLDGYKNQRELCESFQDKKIKDLLVQEGIISRIEGMPSESTIGRRLNKLEKSKKLIPNKRIAGAKFYWVGEEGSEMERENIIKYAREIKNLKKSKPTKKK